MNVAMPIAAVLLDLGFLVIIESTLSFFGLGITLLVLLWGVAVIADSAAENYFITRARLIGRDIDGFFDNAEPGGGDEELISFTAVDDFGIAGDDLHPALCRCRLHRINDPA